MSHHPSEPKHKKHTCPPPKPNQDFNDGALFVIVVVAILCLSGLILMCVNPDSVVNHFHQIPYRVRY